MSDKDVRKEGRELGRVEVLEAEPEGGSGAVLQGSAESKYKAALEAIANGRSLEAVLAEAALDKPRRFRWLKSLGENLAGIATLVIALSGVAFGVLQYWENSAQRQTAKEQKERELKLQRVEVFNKLIPYLTADRSWPTGTAREAGAASSDTSSERGTSIMSKRTFRGAARPSLLGAPAVCAGLLLLASLAAASASRPAPGRSNDAPPPRAASARERIKGITSYVVYYDGEKHLNDLAARLARYDLAILDTHRLTKAEMEALRGGGKLLVSYLSVGEVNKEDPLHQAAQEKGWIIGCNKDWGSSYINVSLPEWQEQMSRSADRILEKGYDGVFLDTVDTVDLEGVSAELRAKLKQGMVGLIHRLRTDHPDMLIVQNRGLSVVSGTGGDIDAVMFEDLSTGYSNESKKYKTFDPNKEMVSCMVKLGKKIPVLALDYAPPGDQKKACNAVKTARKYCFIPSVSVGDLHDIPDYGLGKCQAGPASPCAPQGELPSPCKYSQ